nr:hypothetical protein [Armatimonas sp.]
MASFLRRKARSGLPNQFPQPGTGFAARSATVDAQFHWAVYPVGVPGFARFTPRRVDGDRPALGRFAPPPRSSSV